MWKVINKFKAGTLRAKQLKEFKEEKSLRTLTRFKESNIGKYYKIAVGQYFLKDYPIIIT